MNMNTLQFFMLNTHYSLLNRYLFKKKNRVSSWLSGGEALGCSWLLQDSEGNKRFVRCSLTFRWRTPPTSKARKWFLPEDQTLEPVCSALVISCFKQKLSRWLCGWGLPGLWCQPLCLFLPTEMKVWASPWNKENEQLRCLLRHKECGMGSDRRN